MRISGSNLVTSTENFFVSNSGHLRIASRGQGRASVPARGRPDGEEDPGPAPQGGRAAAKQSVFETYRALGAPASRRHRAAKPTDYGDAWLRDPPEAVQAQKLRDYTEHWPELEASSNPFAIVVMSHLKSRDTRGDGESRLRWKIRLVRRLYKGGWNRQDVLELVRFIDWVLALPTGLERRFKDEGSKLETEKVVRYVTSIERLGREEGFLQGEAAVLKRQLKRRFERLPEWAEQRLDQANRNELEGWADRVIEAKALEDVFA